MKKLSCIVHIQKRRRMRQGLGLFALCSAIALTGCKPKPDTQTTTAPQNTSVATVPAEPVAPAVTLPQKAESPRNEAKKEVAKSDTKTETPVAAAGNASSIAGGWVNAGGACDSGATVLFNADGTYLAEGEKGTWELSGKKLTVTSENTFEESEDAPVGPEQSPGDRGEKSILTLLSVTDDTARVILPNGANARWTRCTG